MINKTLIKFNFICLDYIFSKSYKSNSWHYRFHVFFLELQYTYLMKHVLFFAFQHYFILCLFFYFGCRWFDGGFRVKFSCGGRHGLLSLINRFLVFAMTLISVSADILAISSRMVAFKSCLTTKDSETSSVEPVD